MTSNSVTEVIYEAGFNSGGRFYEKSTGMLGMTPTKYRSGGCNEEIRFVQDRFPKAKLIGADREYEALVARVVGLIEARGQGLDLPLDIRGSAFRQRVWRALQDIAVGCTVSYAELARWIGSPKAVRAVQVLARRTTSRW